MIVLILAGGLGNQMFEYAAAKSMALRAGTDVCINKRLGFQRDKVYQRVYALGQYNLNYVHNRLLSFDFPCGFLFYKLSSKIGRHILFPWYKFKFDYKVDTNDLKKCPTKYKNVILQGTWVKPEFFDDCISIIREDFKIDVNQSSIVKDYIERIEKSNIPIVAMGVRVYQEIKNPELRNDEFYAQAEFYNRALDYYKTQLGVFRLFIFTQAKDWVESNVNLRDVEYEFVQASTCDADALYDMMIMSKCHYYIISNSSYYFWAVCLNIREKQVLIPRQWTLGIMPEWIKI